MTYEMLVMQSIELETKLAAAEKERDAAKGKLDESLSHTVKWMDACGFLRCRMFEIVESISDIEAQQKLFRLADTTFCDSAEKVKKLVDALTHIDGCLSESEHNAIIALEIAQKALAEWRGDNARNDKTTGGGHSWP